jgi:hypothetical protein
VSHQGAKKNKSKKQQQPQRRKGAEERKGKQNEIRNSAVLCAFALLRL